MFADTWHLFNKYMKITVRMPMWTLFTLVQPLIWLIIFGQLFKNMVQLPGWPAGSYMDFFVPGVLIMTVLFGSSWSGVSLLREIQSGTVDKMLVSPVSRVAIVLSRVLHSTAQVLAQVAVMLLVAALVGAKLNWNPVYLLLAMAVVLLLGLCFAAISNGFAIMLQREEPLVMIGNLMTLPLMFFSTALVPKEFMPAWIQYVATINPINYAVEAVRAVLVGTPDVGAFATPFLVLLVVTAVAVFWAVSAFNALRD
ncbi:MAG TPA: ABC transporter permease [Gammaproteobacteria bacterium]|nr:ABC transporter permease [Gammaproteobacteria bacterium]